MNHLTDWIDFIFLPLSCIFYPFLVLIIIWFVFPVIRTKSAKIAWVLGFTVIFYTLFRLLLLSPDANKWLSRISHPVYLTFVFLIFPAVFLPRGRIYKIFLVLPVAAIPYAILAVIERYTQSPKGTGFIWFPMRAEVFTVFVASLLILLQHFVKLDLFRKIVRVTFFLVLIYGGFALRQSLADYRQMMARRQQPASVIQNLSETVPVLKSDNQLFYIPGAPCRFSSDGGYVQGCVMELLQRSMQLKWENAAAGNPGDIAILAIIFAAILSLMILLYIGARWWCGWICPLSALGEIFDWIRKRLGLPHLKISQPVKITALAAGLSFGSFSLLLARAYSYIDADGKFLGCKIPLFPFCKICPGQQICPVAAKGPAGYPPLPGMEFMFGYFRVVSLALLVIFIAAYASARRLWCRICPMGMIGGLFNKGAMLALKKNPKKCNGCGVCHAVCPMDIYSVQKEMVKEDVSNFDCVYCMKCVDKCPRDGCLYVEFAGKEIARSKFIK